MITFTHTGKQWERVHARKTYKEFFGVDPPIRGIAKRLCLYFKQGFKGVRSTLLTYHQATRMVELRFTIEGRDNAELLMCRLVQRPMFKHTSTVNASPS